jgi:hypothetical protein
VLQRPSATARSWPLLGTVFVTLADENAWANDPLSVGAPSAPVTVKSSTARK